MLPVRESVSASVSYVFINESLHYDHFVEEYPENCTKYYGPHPFECLETMWEDVNCLHEGTKYPFKLTSSEKNDFDEMNLR